MSLKHVSLLQTAFRSRDVLTPEAVAQLAAFVNSQAHADGGFCGRAGQQDVYYTVFGLSACFVLGSRSIPDATRRYIDTLSKNGHNRGFIDLACILRCRCIAKLVNSHAEQESACNATGTPSDASAAPATYHKTAAAGSTLVSDWDDKLLAVLETYRCADGGYGYTDPDRRHGSVYAAFLAAQAYRDAGRTPPDVSALLKSVHNLRTPDGGFGNVPGARTGTTTATAAAAELFAAYDVVPEGLADWLLAQSAGPPGFTAGPAVRVPDLLSTATALYGLYTMGVSISEKTVERCYDFLEAVWQETSGFCGSPADTRPDCEYTFYGLLALGCLSGMNACEGSVTPDQPMLQGGR